MVRAHPLSLLARQHLVLRGQFGEKHSGAWLWWEASTGAAPTAESAVSDTWVPGQSAPAGPGETMCFDLIGEGRFRLGSSADVEVVIAHASVAPEHCVLTHDSGGWHVRAGASVPEVVVAGNPLAGEIEVPLESGHEIALGAVKLTFLDAKDFARRVAAAAAKL